MGTSGSTDDSPGLPTSLIYKRPAGLPLVADVYHPAFRQAGERRATIVFFSGGGWITQDRMQFRELSLFFAAQGLVAIAADYRVRATHATTLVEAVMDSKSAIRWVRKNAPMLGIDPARIIAAGGSAGGHIAACAALIEKADDPSDDPSVSPVPDALVLFNPVLDLVRQFSKPDAPARMREGRLRMTAAMRARGFDLADLSPMHHVRGSAPPSIIFHGTEDEIVGHSQAVLFADAMRQAGNTCILVDAPGQAHEFHDYAVSLRRDGGRWYEDCRAQAQQFVAREVLRRNAGA
jgi:acetyl esterase/lipase